MVKTEITSIKNNRDGGHISRITCTKVGGSVLLEVVEKRPNYDTVVNVELSYDDAKFLINAIDHLLKEQ
jgi:hypothetical protein